MKIIKNTIILIALVSTTMTADFLKMEMGAGAYSSTPSGKVSYTGFAATANDISTGKKTINPYIWAYIKHPVPILPNIRLEYSSVQTKGVANGQFENFIALDSNTELNLKQYDIIPYYNILDNTGWITFDLGLDIKVIDVDYSADKVALGSLPAFVSSYNDSSMLLIPLIYTRVRVEIPSTDLALEADAKFIKYSSTTVYDARVKLDYTLSIMPVIEPAIEVGYRVQKYDIDEAELDGKANLEFSGIYIGAMIRF
ncbi:MAG: outer membrane protein [Sulfurimonas sp.]|jgi:outer membrane protein|uniref:TIGR04219 family outer membrane beta-barrel protein n=1 Tax=Sulfurimonas sp. TaxID=2022749 RepID=UPI0039E495C0